MKAEFHRGNRERLYAKLPEGSLLVMFSGEEITKTNDEYYPFFADRSFVYLTGLECKEAVLLAAKDAEGSVEERVYILPPDAFAERWTGVRVKPYEAIEISGAEDIRSNEKFETDFRALANSGNYGHLYLDLFRINAKDIDRPAQRFLNYVQQQVPFFTIGNANALVRELRLIKQPCEIEALRQAEKITKAGIVAMMEASKPGMYEYQYKAEFDYALAQRGVLSPGFPSIISSGKNNFKIHYYDYRGQAQDGDMILDDVGAVWDYEINDVSRAFPCNGRFNDRQKLLYECIYNTSEYMFSTLKPGVPLLDVDKIIRKYTFEQLKEAGVCKNFEDIGTYMWHGGAHHVGFDVHDVVEGSGLAVPGVVFCVDIGVYHEEWGIGFRLEDNCLITEDGCENLSRAIPRQIDEIEAFMGRR